MLLKVNFPLDGKPNLFGMSLHRMLLIFWMVLTLTFSFLLLNVTVNCLLGILVSFPDNV